MTVNYVPQREAWDCGVASLAMAAGVSYEEALAVVPESQRGELLHTVHFTQWLGALGCAVRKTYADQDDLRGIRLLCHRGHFVVARPDDKVNDPARGEGLPLANYADPFDVWEVHRLAPAAALSQAGEPGREADARDHADCATMDDVVREVFCRLFGDDGDAGMAEMEKWREWYKPSDWLWWGRGLGAFLFLRVKARAAAAGATREGA